jgi:hypothetical protein
MARSLKKPFFSSTGFIRQCLRRSWSVSGRTVAVAKFRNPNASIADSRINRLRYVQLF